MMNPSAGNRSPTSALQEVASDATRCRRCPLYRDATQVVFGEGPSDAAMLVGEQPGNQEDRSAVCRTGRTPT